MSDQAIEAGGCAPPVYAQIPNDDDAHDAARWRFWCAAMLEDDGTKRAAIAAQPFPRTKAGFDLAIDAAMILVGNA